MFNFDSFINKPSIEIFGQVTTITPVKTEFAAFEINGDFHEDYKEVNPDSSEVSITSSVIAIFIRNADLPDYYPKINQGDLIEIDGKNYQIIDVQIHIPGSKKLVLHESSEINN
jgi:hypothetical protein